MERFAPRMNVVLISTYELGHQPFGLASPAAWLRERGHEVRCLDLSRETLDELAIRRADLIACYVPMHTATRLAVELIEPVRRLNPRAKLCFYGLYAPVNEVLLRQLGVDAILGGEFEQGLVSIADRLAPRGATKVNASSPGACDQTEPIVSLARQHFLVPDRSGLVPLDRYAKLSLPGGGSAVVGYTEASRGCKHRCRHCPVVPVYNGVFRIVEPEVVLEDVRRQVRAGAEHITFGDPDFFNGPRHALGIVRALHEKFPDLTYDATIKVEHLLARRADLGVLRDTGCLFVTTAVESLDDAVLARLEKGHTRADFFEVVRLFDDAGLALHPTFIPFTPWTTLDGYEEFVETLARLGLAENIAPVQMAIRLLVPAGSRLMELEEIRALLGPFDAEGLVYPWRHEDTRVDRLQRDIEQMVKASQGEGLSRAETFTRIECAARAAAATGRGAVPRPATDHPRIARAAIPFLTEPWYC
jgi:radical SAM superfamily enzyme YgiQ (UPF0313 family)